MNINTLISDMYAQESAQEIYISLYQKHSEPAEKDVNTAMECDEELVEELDLDLKENEVKEENEVNFSIDLFFCRVRY